MLRPRRSRRGQFCDKNGRGSTLPFYIFELLDSSFTGEIDVSYENPIDKNYIDEFYSAKNNSSYDFSVKTPDLLNSDLSKILYISVTLEQHHSIA